MSEVEWMREYWDNGTLYCEVPYINGHKHGVARWYFSSGALEQEISYSNDKAHGIQRWYYENGEIRLENLKIKGKKRNDLLGDKHRLMRLMLLGGE